MPTDTSEKELERIIVAAMTGGDSRRPTALGETLPALAGYVAGSPAEYDRDHAVDLGKLLAFLHATQPDIVEQFALEIDGPPRRKFLDRLQGEIARRGVIDVLRKGVKDGPVSIDLFYGCLLYTSPSPRDRTRSRMPSSA